MELIVILAAIMFILFIIKKLYKTNWNKGISANLSLSENEAFPGDEIILTETIVNNKWLPLPMIKVKFEVDKSFVFNDIVVNTNVSDKCYKSDVFSILFYQKIIRKLPFTCTKRGYYQIKSMDVVSTDVFMDSVLASIFPVSENITVYPEPINSEAVDVPFNRLMGTILTKHYAYEDPFEFRGIREYQTYDTMKSINWNASARTGDLKVNIHDYTASQQVSILLNLENEGVWEYEVLKEKSISMACSLAHRLTMQGISVSIITNGVDKLSGEEICLASGSDESHRQNIMTSLARIDLKKKMVDFTQTMEKNRRFIDDGAVLMMISTCKKESVQKYYEKLAQEHKGSMWLFPFHAGMDASFEYIHSAEVLEWELEI